jgi:hypothetical protein
MTDKPDPQDVALSLEGRILAHRSLLVELLRHLPEDRVLPLLDWMEERTHLLDGQEDPGAVPSPAAGLELARADEFRMLKRLVETKRSA